MMTRAKQFPGQIVSLDAAADLSAKQFLFMAIDSSGEIDIAAGQGLQVSGVLQDDPAAQGRPGALMISGVSKVISGDTIVAGNLVTTGADGRAEVAAMGDIVAGEAWSDGVDGESISVLLYNGHIVA